jgi:hypothetical protein
VQPATADRERISVAGIVFLENAQTKAQGSGCVQRLREEARG